jgi:hypothetical protein
MTKELEMRFVRKFGVCGNEDSVSTLVMAKLDNASGTVIAITFLVMNLATWWRRVFCVFLCLFGKRTPVFWLKIIYNYTWAYRHRKNLSLTELEYIARSCYWFAIDYSAKPK